MKQHEVFEHIEKQINALREKIEKDYYLYRLVNKYGAIRKPEKYDINASESNNKVFMEIMINDLAMQWDSRINKIREENGGYLLQSLHRFLISDPKELKAAHSPVLRKTNRFLPPDKRFGIVSCNSKKVKRMIVMSILHEMGHFIGKRERLYRFENVFIPMLSERIIYEISARYCGLIDNTDENARIEVLDYSKDNQSKIQAQEQVIYSIYSMQSELQKTLQTWFIQFKNKALETCDTNQEDAIKSIEEIIKQLKKIPTWKDIDVDSKPIKETIKENIKEIISRQKTSIDMSFFIQCRGVLTKLLSVLLATESVGKDSFFIKTASAIATASSTSIEEAKKRLKPCFDIMRNGCIMPFPSDNLKDPPVWYRDAEEILEETAADIFMLRICDEYPSSYQYCHLLMECLQENNNNTKKTLSELITMPSNLLRIIGVCHAIENHTYNHWQKLDHQSGRCPDNERILRIENYINHIKTSKKQQMHEAYDYLKHQYRRVELYRAEENETPVLLRKDFFYFCYTPKLIALYLDYIDMIWKMYDQIFEEYKDNSHFERPIVQIRRELKRLVPNKRGQYIEQAIQDWKDQ